MADININKITNGMRSLYRLIELEKMNSPSIMIENEKNILQKYLLSLTKEEILYFSNNFNRYYKSEVIKSALDDERLSQMFAHNLANLN
jgi:hypothetical protein